MEKRIKLSFTVGIEFICDSDDELIFDYKLTKEEFDKLVDIEVKQIWEEEHESWNDIEAFFPELFEKLRRKLLKKVLKSGVKNSNLISIRNMYMIFLFQTKYMKQLEKLMNIRNIQKFEK